jgi:pyocin large subunit-like protein
MFKSVYFNPISYSIFLFLSLNSCWNSWGGTPVDNKVFRVFLCKSKSLQCIQYRFIWSGGKYKNAAKNAFAHFKKHGHEFPEHFNALKYVESAHELIQNPPPDTLIKIRANGERIFYHQPTETLIVQSVKGVPETMFKFDPLMHGYPTNLDYFDSQ